MDMEDRVRTVTGDTEAIRGLYTETEDGRTATGRAVASTDRRVIEVTEATTDDITVRTIPYAQVTGVDIDIKRHDLSTLGLIIAIAVAMVGVVMLFVGSDAGAVMLSVGGMVVVLLGIAIGIIAFRQDATNVDVTIRTADRSNVTFEFDEAGVEWASGLTSTLGDLRSRN